MTLPPLVKGTDWDRGYLNPVTGEFAPSVTTILKVIHKKELDNWAARMAADYAVKNWDELSGCGDAMRRDQIKSAPEVYTTQKADLGTAVHEVADRWMKGIPSEETKETSSYISQFIRFLAEFKPRFTGTEATVWSRRDEYAGTADIFAVIDGENWLIDIKTGKGIYPETGLQLAALANAEFRILPDGTELELPRFDEWAVLHLRPRGWKLVPIREKEACHSAFLGAREIFRFLNETAEHVLGEPL